MKHVFLAAAMTAMLATPAFADVTLSLSPPSPAPVLGEPVSVIVTLRNAGSGPETVARRLKPEYGATEFHITPPGGTRQRFSPFALKELADPVTSLAAGGSLSETAELYHDGKTWTFRTPGRYLIEASYHGAVKAEPIVVEIAAPRNDAEQAAARQLLGSSEAGLFMLVNGAENLEEGRRVVSNVAEAYAATPQATHANLALGVHLSRAAADFRAGRMRAADPAGAAQRLDRVDIERLGPEQLGMAEVAGTRAFQALGQPQRLQILRERLNGTLQRRFPTMATKVRADVDRAVESR